MTQTITPTEEQREFRAVVRQFAEDKIAPLAAEADRIGEYSLAGVRGAAVDGADRPVLPGGVRRSRRRPRRPRRSWPRSWPGCDASTSLMFLISKLAMLPVINFGSEELKARTCPGSLAARARRSYCLSRGRRRLRRRVDDHPGGARRRRLRLQRHEVWITNAGDLATSTRCSPRPIRRPGTGASPRSWSRRTGACSRQARAQARASGLARPARSCFDDVRVPAANRIGEEGEGFYSPCTRSTAAARPSAPRRSASPRAPSTTPSAT